MKISWPKANPNRWWNIAALVFTFAIGAYIPFLFVHHRWADFVWFLLLLVFVWR